jgi:hypothetical protein
MKGHHQIQAMRDNKVAPKAFDAGNTHKHIKQTKHHLIQPSQSTPSGTKAVQSASIPSTLLARVCMPQANYSAQNWKLHKELPTCT